MQTIWCNISTFFLLKYDSSTHLGYHCVFVAGFLSTFEHNSVPATAALQGMGHYNLEGAEWGRYFLHPRFRPGRTCGRKAGRRADGRKERFGAQVSFFTAKMEIVFTKCAQAQCFFFFYFSNHAEAYVPFFTVQQTIFGHGAGCRQSGYPFCTVRTPQASRVGEKYQMLVTIARCSLDGGLEINWHHKPIPIKPAEVG